MANISKPQSNQRLFEAPGEICFRIMRERVLNYFLRNYSIIRYNTILMGLSKEELNAIAFNLKFPYIVVDMFISRFMSHMVHFKEFLSKKMISYGSRNIIKKGRIYLHKIHNLAPVFDYKKSRVNFKTLQILLSQENIWPTITTQIAIVIYITDKLDKNTDKELIQKNIQTICNCSAYAFHRTKNHLHIDEIIKSQLNHK